MIKLGQYRVEARQRECGLFAIQLLTGLPIEQLREIACEIDPECMVIKEGRRYCHIEPLYGMVLIRLKILDETIAVRPGSAVIQPWLLQYAILEGKTSQYPVHYVALAEEKFADNFHPKFVKAEKYPLLRDFELRWIYILKERE